MKTQSTPAPWLVLESSRSIAAAFRRGAQNAPRPFFTEFKVLPLSARLKSPPLTSRRLLPVVVGCVVVSEALTAEAAASRAPQPTAEVASCLRAAAQKFSLDVRLLKAIARVESGFNSLAVRRPHTAGGDGTTDYGLMQINSTWLPKLKSWGITKEDLFNPCVSAEVGAWVLKSNFRDMGVSWDAVGAYNARSPEKRKVYAWRVYRALLQIQKGGQHEGKGLTVAEQHTDTLASVDPAWSTQVQEVQAQGPSRPSFIQIQQARHEGEGQ